MKYAKDYKCDVKGCEEQAVVFVGIADPDCKQYPKCREHADQYKMDVIMMLQDVKLE